MTTLALGTLKNEQMGNATGIFNLMRNLGGGIGIATVSTLIARGSQTHQAILSAHMTNTNPVFLSNHAAIQGALTPNLGPIAANGMANGIMYGQLLQQSSLLAYIDTFRLLAWLCVLCLPLLFFFKKTRARGSISAH